MREREGEKGKEEGKKERKNTCIHASHNTFEEKVYLKTVSNIFFPILL